MWPKQGTLADFITHTHILRMENPQQGDQKSTGNDDTAIHNT